MRTKNIKKIISLQKRIEELKLLILLSEEEENHLLDLLNGTKKNVPYYWDLEQRMLSRRFETSAYKNKLLWLISYLEKRKKMQNQQSIKFDGVIKELEEQCNKNNLQFIEDWVHIDTQNGVAVVQNEYGRILASIHF